MRPTRWIAPVALVVVLLGVVQAARADSFAAIAYSKCTGRYGYAYGQDDLCAAQNAAVAGANAPDAQVVVSVKNGWAALAVNDKGGWGYGWSTKCQADADRFALDWAASSGCGAHIICRVVSGN